MLNKKIKPTVETKFSTCRDKHQKHDFYVDVFSQNPEVTGSCTLFFVRFSNKDKIKFFIDCGMFQESEHQKLNEKFIFKPDEIEFACLTHGHIDHIGRVPIAVNQGLNCPIYTTLGTKLIMKEALEDNCRIQEDSSKRQNRKSSTHSIHDVEKTLELTEPLELYKQKNVYNKNGNKITISIIGNAHIFGACSIFINIIDVSGKDIRFFITGDYKESHEFFSTKEIPRWIKDSPVTIITESTYGDTNSRDIKKEFEKNISKITSDEKYTTGLIPVFSLDRAQKILYILKNMQINGTLDKNIPVFYDGKLSMKYSRMIQKNPETFNLFKKMRDFLPMNCHIVDKNKRCAILNDLTSKRIIVSTSGMGSYGPTQTYIPALLPHDNCYIHFVGHQEPHTIGGKLLASKNNDLINLNGVIKPLRAAIYETAEMTSHAMADQLIELLKKFSNIQCILIHHGEQDVKEIFAKRILLDKNIKVKDIGVFDGTTMFRISPYGMVKSILIK